MRPQLQHVMGLLLWARQAGYIDWWAPSSTSFSNKYEQCQADSCSRMLNTLVCLFSVTCIAVDLAGFQATVKRASQFFSGSDTDEHHLSPWGDNSIVSIVTTWLLT